MYTGEFSGNQNLGSTWYDVNFYSFPSILERDSGGDYPGLTSKIEGVVTVILTWTQDYEGEESSPPKWAAIDVTGEAHADYVGQDSSTNVSATMGREKGRW